jgi:hypothetical protein
MLDAASGQMWVRGRPARARREAQPDRHHHLRPAPRPTYPRGSPVWFFKDGWRVDFENERAGSLYTRNVAAGESYSWGD